MRFLAKAIFFDSEILSPNCDSESTIKDFPKTSRCIGTLVYTKHRHTRVLIA